MDTLEAHREQACQLDLQSILRYNLLDGSAPPYFPEDYALMTMHRPSNVDAREILGPIVDVLINKISSQLSLFWPVHPRSVKQLKKFGLWSQLSAAQNIYLLEPVSYKEMLNLNLNARIMLTDSGGLQEECCVLGTPCLTLRYNTERPITLKENGGTSVLVGNDVQKIEAEFDQIMSNYANPSSFRPPLWDGNTAQRCLRSIINFHS